MKANVVKLDNITTITFDSNNLIIFEDDEVFARADVLDRIAGQADQTHLSISELPSMRLPDRAGSVFAYPWLRLLEEHWKLVQSFRRILAQYFSRPYNILSFLQIHKFNQPWSIGWDPQEQLKRLVAHATINDIYVTPPGSEQLLVKERSIFVCSRF